MVRERNINSKKRMQFFTGCAIPYDCAFQNKLETSPVLRASVIINLFIYCLFHLTHTPSFKKEHK